MAAALRAHECGARVAVIDDNPAAGGQIWRRGDSQSSQWFARFTAADIPVITGASVISGDLDSGTLLIETENETLELSFHALILATGAREVFLPFPGWTLPGVMGVGGIQALVKSGMPVSGKRVVIAGSGPLMLAAAAYLRKQGAYVKLIAEQASRGVVARFVLQLLRSPGKIVQAARLQLALLGVPYLHGCWVEAAEGNGRVEKVRLRHGGKTWTEDCDYAGIAYGLCPNTELASLLGCRIEETTVAVDEFQQSSLDRIFCAGECTGIGGLDLSLIEGEIAGYAACGRKDLARRLFGKRSRALRFAGSLNNAFTLRDELKSLPRPGTFVCRCEDVTFERLQNMPSFRAAKLHTRCGMGSCQGRVCGPAADFLFGWRTESIRPPIFPARLGSLAFEKESIPK
jgi:D-hydroxyproline dehydrogenase subunit alpha